MFRSTTQNRVASWCQGISFNDFASDKPVIGISTDTRSLRAGEIFLALRGENFDGHQFIVEAVKKGAVAVISERSPEGPIPLLRVTNSQAALISIGRGQRGLFDGGVIAVTGSAGKSSTKEMIAALLGPNTVASPASFNNLIGVSKTLCLLDNDTRHLILEMGMNALGEIAELCKSFSPQFGVITNIGDAHLGKLGGREGVYRAKKELFDYLASISCRGVALNSDDSLVLRAFGECFVNKKVENVSYSARAEDTNSAVRVRNYQIDPETAYLSVQIEVNHKSIHASLPIFGMHHVQNLAAAIAVATLYGKSVEEIKSRTGDIKPGSHRGEVHRLAHDRTLIDESYNSNPSALLSSLESLMRLSQKRRILMVIGEMRELGDFSDAEHLRVGLKLGEWLNARPGEFVVIGVGQGTNALLQPLQGATRIQSCVVPSVEEAIELTEKKMQPGDIVFVKGSRGVGLDKLIRHLVLPKKP